MHSLAFHGVVKFSFLVDLDCKLLACTFLKTNVNYCVGTLANWLSNLIILKTTWTTVSICGRDVGLVVLTRARELVARSVHAKGDNARGILVPMLMLLVKVEIGC